MFDPAKTPYFDPSKNVQISIVTGGNQGIGFYTVLHLYLHGFKVYMLGRNEEKCLEAIKKIKEEAKQRESNYTESEKGERFLGLLEYTKCDLTELASVAAAAESIIEKEEHLDLLINNAGIMGCPFEKTVDDIEIQYQVNVTGHFLLTMKLLPLLKKASSPRVVHVTSLGHLLSNKYYKNNEDLDHSPKVFYAYKRYGVAKLGIIHFIKQLAKQNPDILCIAVHPGIINTNLYLSTWTTNGYLGTLGKTIFNTFNGIASVSKEVGAYAALRGALDDSLSKEDENGVYLTTAGVKSTPSRLARDPELAKQTWDYNYEQLTKRGFL